MEYTVLVNKSHPVGRNYIPDNLITIHEITGEKIDKTYENKLEEMAYLKYKEMQNKALEEGYEIFIDSAYRSYEYQEKLFNEFIKKYGLDETKRVCALPGESEHQTGLAIDIILKRGDQLIEDVTDNDPEIKWLKNNCYKFGYILRYPIDKENITGYKYEPWHFRYIGEKAASEMKENSITTLEEYTTYNLEKAKKLSKI